MSRFLSWLAIGLAAAFLVVASVAFSASAVTKLAFAVSIGTLVVSVGIAYIERTSVTSVYTAVLIALISVWTIVASLVFSQATVQHLVLASSLAISALTIVGLTAHEISLEEAVAKVTPRSTEEDSSVDAEARLAAAA